MENDNTLKQPEGEEAYREIKISDDLLLRVYSTRMIFISGTEEEGSAFEIASADGMEVAKFIVLLLPIGQRLKVAAALTTSAAKAIG